MKEIIDKLIRSKHGIIYGDDNNLCNDKIINKYFNITGRKLKQHYICLLKEYLNDDLLFKEMLEKYKPKIFFFKSEVYFEPCSDCNLNCFNDLSDNFISAASMFIIQIDNFGDIFNKQDKKHLATTFFNGFYIHNGIWCHNFEEIHRLIIDFVLSFLSKSLFNNKPLDNIKELYEIKDFLDETLIRMKNISRPLKDEDYSDYVIIKNFIDSKIEYYEKIYTIEKEINVPLDKDKEKADEVTNLIYKTKIDIILQGLNEYGFSELKSLTNINVKDLVNHIFTEKVPYQIAYLFFLNFHEKLYKMYFNSYNEVHIKLAEIINSSERSVRGNINGLRNRQSTDRHRYTAYLHLEKVEEHFALLKKGRTP